jgi:hypothetical protein
MIVTAEMQNDLDGVQPELEDIIVVLKKHPPAY